MVSRWLGRGGWSRLGFALAVALFESSVRGQSQAETHYGLVFDAGSSGSRVHVYSYRSGGDAGDFELVQDLLLKSKPGLSSFADDPRAAAQSLRGLLDFAQEKVPKAQHGSTPVFLMASAGLRALSEEKREAILESVRDVFWESPFLFIREWAYIMSGRDEGVYGWVTVNYLLEALGEDKSRSTGVIDLGGGSVQMVYHMPSNVKLAAEANTGTVLHGVHKHSLYVASHSHGLDAARKTLLESITHQHFAVGKDPTASVEHPCLANGHTAQQKLKDGSLQSYVGTGSFDECASLYRKQFSKDLSEAACTVPPCAIGGVFQPELPASIFGFSYLYDRTRAIGLLDGQAEEFGIQKMTIADIEKAAQALCSSSPSEAAPRFKECEDAAKWENFCGDATYLTVLLNHGFGIARDTELTMGNKIKDIEIVWTLGALISKSGSAMAKDLAKDYLKTKVQSQAEDKVSGGEALEVGMSEEHLKEYSEHISKRWSRDDVHRWQQQGLLASKQEL